MSEYVDVYLLPIPAANIPAYKKVATKAGKLFLKHGALRYREYAASDLKVEDCIVPFPSAVPLKDGETLVYAAVEFKSESHRSRAMKSIFNDPALTAIMGDKPLFDYERMVYGGFKVIVDL